MSTFESWALLELMGHRVRAGYVREVEIAGAKLLRIDIPVSKDEVGQDVTVTEFYSAAAIYALRPTTEELVRVELARHGGMDPRPMRPLDYRDRPRLTDQAAEDDDGPDEELEDAVDRGVAPMMRARAYKPANTAPDRLAT